MNVLGQTKILNAQVISKKDSTSLVGVHVVNMNSNQATNTISDGFFSIPYQAGDTIVLTSIGFNDHFLYTGLFWIPHGQLITIYMSERVYSLPGVDVNQYSSKEEFKEDFTNRKPSQPIDNEMFQYKKASDLEDVETDLNAKVTLRSPISLLYSKFGKEARQAKKLKKAQEQEERAKILEEKYNPMIVQKVLEMDTRVEAEQFMEGCPLEDDFIIKAKEYDIVKAILDCDKSNK